MAASNDAASIMRASAIDWLDAGGSRNRRLCVEMIDWVLYGGDRPLPNLTDGDRVAVLAALEDAIDVVYGDTRLPGPDADIHERLSTLRP